MKRKCIIGYRRGKTYAAGTKKNKREEGSKEQRESKKPSRREVGIGTIAKIRLQLEELEKDRIGRKINRN